MDNLREIEDDVHNAYRAVREALPGVPVVVVPYPIPVSERRVCDYTPFRDEEHRFVHVFVEALDDVLQQEAEEVGFHFADGVRQAFGTEYRLCDGSTDEVAVNFVDLNGVFGTLEHSANPLNWVHNSMHPNDLGHELMQAALSPTLQVVLATPDAPAIIVKDSDDAALQEILTDVCRRTLPGPDRRRATDCANDWTLEKTSSFLLKSLAGRDPADRRRLAARPSRHPLVATPLRSRRAWRDESSDPSPPIRRRRWRRPPGRRG